MSVNGEKVGLGKRFRGNLHGETRYGNIVNFDTGGSLPILVAARSGNNLASSEAFCAIFRNTDFASCFRLRHCVDLAQSIPNSGLLRIIKVLP